jgi:ubiquitin carboxyl-terminal hydrolase L3
MSYRKHFIPLESDPDIFSSLSHELGVPPSLVFQDVLSIDDRELLAFVPRPVLALVLVFPSSSDYESSVRIEDESKQNYIERGEDDGVLWFQQTINNACGLYAVLHAVCNGDARGHIGERYMKTIESYADEDIPQDPVPPWLT